MDFLGGSVWIGRVFGINVRLHMLFLIWMGFRLLNAGAGWQSSLLFIGTLFGIVLLHEFGHCFGARAVGGWAEEVLLWPLGGLAFAHAPMTPWAQFVTVAAGPAVNVVLCAISAIVLIATTGDPGVVSVNPLVGFSGQVPTLWQAYLGLFYDLNLWLFCFNMLPIFPMDGGQLLRTFLWPSMGLSRATMITAQLGLLGAILFGVWGIQRQSMILVAIAIFGGITCWQHYQAARFGHLREDFTPRVARPRRRGGGFWAALFGPKARIRYPEDAGPIELPRAAPRPTAREEAIDDVDRILKKVSEQGIQSLSYVERQALERATRERRERGSV